MAHHSHPPAIADGPGEAGRPKANVDAPWTRQELIPSFRINRTQRVHACGTRSFCASQPKNGRHPELASRVCETAEWAEAGRQRSPSVAFHRRASSAERGAAQRPLRRRSHKQFEVLRKLRMTGFLARCRAQWWLHRVRFILRDGIIRDWRDSQRFQSSFRRAERSETACRRQPEGWQRRLPANA